MVEVQNPVRSPHEPEPDSSEPWKLKNVEYENILAESVTNAGNNAFLASKGSSEMVGISRMYFDRAIDGHRKAIPNPTLENIEAIYCSSVLVSICALFTLSESEDDSMLPAVDPVQWLRLARGTIFFTKRWQDMVGENWLSTSGTYYGQLDKAEADELFDRDNEKPFAKLLTWREDFAAMPLEDQEAYQKTLAYIGLIYKGIVDDTDTPLATCRRILAMPSRCPPRFVNLAEAKQPRALAMLAYVFATMKLRERVTPWFRGIAERQVPKIYEQLPHAWRDMMAWPRAVVRGEFNKDPMETHIGDILVL